MLTPKVNSLSDLGKGGQGFLLKCNFKQYVTICDYFMGWSHCGIRLTQERLKTVLLTHEYNDLKKAKMPLRRRSIKLMPISAKTFSRRSQDGRRHMLRRKYAEIRSQDL